MAVGDYLATLPGWEFVLFIALVFIFFVGTVVTCIIVLHNLRWPFKYVVTEDVSGTNNHQITRRGRARLIAFGDGGEEIFFLKNIKKLRVGYGKRIGPKQIMWSIGGDGYWYNVTLGSIDKKLKEIGVNPVHVAVRLAMASMRKGVDSRYNKLDFMQKYGNVVYFGMFLIALMMFGGVMWFAFDKQADISNIFAQSVEAQNKNLDTQLAITNKQGEIVNALGELTGQGTLVSTPNTQGGGSGIQQVETIPPDSNG